MRIPKTPRRTDHFHHGLSRSKEYHVWQGMMQRCYNKNDRRYKNYGGRGIAVDKTWHRFEVFIKDMGRRPSDKHSVGRKNNDLGYSKWNCRWETREEQDCNTTTAKLIMFNGERLTLTQWANKLGKSRSMLRARLVRGWSVRDSFTAPPFV